MIIQLGNDGIHPFLEDLLNKGYCSRKTLETIFAGDFYSISLNNTKRIILVPSYIEYLLRSYNKENLNKSKSYRLRDLLDKVALCEELTPPEERQNYMEKICNIFYHADKVNNAIPNGLRHLFKRFPLYKPFYKERYTGDIAWDKFKELPSVQPAFNGSGCVIL